MKLSVWWIFCFSLDLTAKCQENRYGLKGKSIRLRISSRNHSDPISNVLWRRFSRKDLLAKGGAVSPQFNHKMNLNVSDWSLKINNLQESDTGLYEALTNWEDQTLAAFLLSVEDAVSEPVISVSPPDFNSSCRAVFNCSLDDSWALYDCDQSVCTQTLSSLTSVNITFITLDSGVWCHVSNHVSHNRSQAPNRMCHQKHETDQSFAPPLIFWPIIAICALILLGLITSLIIAIVKKRRSSKVHPQSRHNVIDDPNVVKEHLETVYSTIQRPDASQTPPENSTETTTIYDTPTRQPKARPVDSVEVKSDNEEPERSGSDRTLKVTATVHQEAEADSDQINTVYCKLGEI